MKRKITILVTVLSCLFTLHISPAFAVEDLMKYAPDDQTFYMNEFDAINNKIEEYDKQLKTRTVLSTKEKDEYNLLLEEKEAYINYIYSQKKLSVDELKAQNYTDEQIEAIKTYDGSDEMSSRASASLSGNLSLTAFNYNSTRDVTNASVTFFGSWNGTPLWKFTDVIAVAIYGSASDFADDEHSNKVVYNTGTVTDTACTIHPMAGVSYKIVASDVHGDIFKNFSMSYSAVADNKVTIISIGAVYVHYKLALSGVGVSIGVDTSGNASAGLSFGIEWYGDKVYEKFVTKQSYI